MTVPWMKLFKKCQLKYIHSPGRLDLHAQGRFALGFYQQKAADRVAREAAEAAKEKKESKPINLSQKGIHQ